MFVSSKDLDERGWTCTAQGPHLFQMNRIVQECHDYKGRKVTRIRGRVRRVSSWTEEDGSHKVLLLEGIREKARDLILCFWWDWPNTYRLSFRFDNKATHEMAFDVVYRGKEHGR